MCTSEWAFCLSARKTELQVRFSLRLECPTAFFCVGLCVQWKPRCSAFQYRVVPFISIERKPLELNRLRLKSGFSTNQMNKMKNFPLLLPLVIKQFPPLINGVVDIMISYVDFLLRMRFSMDLLIFVCLCVRRFTLGSEPLVLLTFQYRWVNFECWVQYGAPLQFFLPPVSSLNV